MIVEFNGLSGTGKTTAARALGQELEKLGCKVVYTYPIKESRLKRYCSYLFDGSAALWFMGWCLALKDVSPKKSERLPLVANIISYYRMYRHFSRSGSDAVLIVDQGVVQAISSIVHMDELTETKMLRRVFRQFDKKEIRFYRVDCITDPKLSLVRIRERNAPTGRWESCTDQEMERGFTNQVQTFDKIRECANGRFGGEHLVIDTRQTPDSNAEKITAFLTQKGECFEGNS